MNLTEQQKEQVKQIQERQVRRYRSADATLNSNREDRDNIDFLLSLLDGQAAQTKSAHELAVEWSQSISDDGIGVDDINRLAQLFDHRTTLMRDKCVSVVKGLWTTNKGNDYNGALNDVLRLIESLALDTQEKQ